MGFLVYLIDSLVIICIYLFVLQQVVWVNTGWALYALLAFGIPRRVEATPVRYSEWNRENGVCEWEVVTRTVAQSQAARNLMAKEKEEPMHLSRQWRHQAGKGFDHCKEQRVPPGDLWFFESESDDLPPATIIAANFLWPPHLWLLSALGTRCCFCLQCPFPPHSFLLTSQAWVKPQLACHSCIHSPLDPSLHVFASYWELRCLPSHATKAHAPPFICLCHKTEISWKHEQDLSSLYSVYDIVNAP